MHKILHITHITYTMHIYFVESGGPAAERKGTQYYVLVRPVPTEYVLILSALLVYLSLILREVVQHYRSRAANSI